MRIVRAISPSLCIIYFIRLFSDKRLTSITALSGAILPSSSFLALLSRPFSIFLLLCCCCGFALKLRSLLLIPLEVGIEPNGQALLRSTKLIFFNSSSRRSLTRGQPQGKSLKCCDGLTCYFGRPGAILTYLDRSSTLSQRASWIDCVWHNDSCVSCATILEQFETDRRRSITRCIVCIFIARPPQLRRGLTTQRQFHYVWMDSNSNPNRAGANLVSADWTLRGKHCTRHSAHIIADRGKRFSWR